MTEIEEKINSYFNPPPFKRKTKDTEFDDLLWQSVQPLYERALKKVSIIEQDCINDPVMVVGPPNFRSLHGMKFRIKKGKDNYLRFIPVGITIYNFINHSLLVYQCDFDPTTSNPLNECTSEYFYNDIVSFETITESTSKVDYTWKDNIIKAIPLVRSVVNTGKIIQKDRIQRFILTTMGGTRLPVTLTEDELKEGLEGAEFPLSEAYKSINIVRRIIRDKKSYTLSTTQKYDVN